MQQLDIVCVSHLWWDWVWQRPQHLLSRIAREHRVFWVEEPHITLGNRSEAFQVTEERPNLSISRLIKSCDQERFWSMLSEAMQRTGATNFKLPDTIQEASLLFDSPLQPLLEDLSCAYVRTWRQNPLVLWLYTPLAVQYVDLLQPDLVVYDVMDDLTSFQYAPPQLKQREQELIERADLVFTGGPSLYAAREHRRGDVHLFPSGVEQEHFARALDDSLPPMDRIADLEAPVIGFFGVIDERIDLDLLARAAEARPEWNWVMIGPVIKIEEHRLPQSPNIHYLGKQAYSDLPAYLRHFDVAMLPFARNEATRFISPTKTLEYMAAHKPIVSTPITDVMTLYAPVVRIAETAPQFIEAIEHALHESDGRRAERIAVENEWLRQYAWDNIAATMLGLIADRLGSK